MHTHVLGGLITSLLSQTSEFAHAGSRGVWRVGELIGSGLEHGREARARENSAGEQALLKSASMRVLRCSVGARASSDRLRACRRPAPRTAPRARSRAESGVLGARAPGRPRAAGPRAGLSLGWRPLCPGGLRQERPGAPDLGPKAAFLAHGPVSPTGNLRRLRAQAARPGNRAAFVRALLSRSINPPACGMQRRIPSIPYRTLLVGTMDGCSRHQANIQTPWVH